MFGVVQTRNGDTENMKNKKVAVYYLAEDGFMHLGHFERKREPKP